MPEHVAGHCSCWGCVSRWAERAGLLDDVTPWQRSFAEGLFPAHVEAEVGDRGDEKA